MGDSVDNVAQRLRNLLKFDKVHLDNLLFKLHHQVNFGVLLLGVLFIFGENYLNENANVCNNKADEYAKNFCWLHGTGHIPDGLASEITGLCAMEKNKERGR